MDGGSGEGQVFESDHDCRLENLRWINIYEFTGTRTQLKLIEFLLQNSPKLVTLDISKHDDCHEEWGLVKEFLRFPRVSSKAAILLGDEWD